MTVEEIKQVEAQVGWLERLDKLRGNPWMEAYRAIEVAIGEEMEKARGELRELDKQLKEEGKK